MPDVTRPPRLILQLAYRAHVERVRSRLDASGIPARRMAARVGRSERCVYEVLGLVVPGRPTVALIEAELDRIAAETPLLDADGGASGDGDE